MPGLCSLNEVKAALLVATSETALDDTLEALIAEICSSCERLTERVFLAAGYSNEVYAGNGLNVLNLRNYPVDSAATFQLKDYTPEQGLTVLDSADYSVDYDNGIVRLRGGLVFAPGPDSVRVTYTAGYAVSGTGDDEKVGVPDELSASVANLVKCAYRRRQGGISYEEYADEKTAAEKIWYGYTRLR